MRNQKVFLAFLLISSLIFSLLGSIKPPALAFGIPNVVAFFPADGSVQVASSSNLFIYFDKSVSLGSGNIYIKREKDNSIFETIIVSSGQVSVDGSTVTINPSSVLERDEEYYIEMDGMAIIDHEGISGQSTWNFHTANDLFVAELVADINTVGAGSDIADSAIMDGILYFKAHSFDYGEEFWRSDGTAEGTYMVKNINSGMADSSPYNFIVMNGVLYFAATDNIYGEALWRSDGTADGTYMVKDINSEGSPYFSSFLVLGNNLIFSAADTSYNLELWKSNGTADGTEIVRDIYTGTSGSNPSGLVLMGDYVYFAANNGSNGAELWRSDGTVGNTTMVRDIRSGATGSSSSGFKVVDGVLYFSANDGTNGAELWRSDGTVGGTTMVRNIRSGSTSSSPEYFTALSNVLYFAANDGVSGKELWKSDGTFAGTVLVKDIWSGLTSSFLNDLVAADNLIYFKASDASSTGYELWRTDGTSDGTYMVEDMYVGDNGVPFLSYNASEVVGDVLYFRGTDGVSGLELWRSDGTASGTFVLKDINPGVGHSEPRYFKVYENIFYFTSDDGVHGAELWKSDGTVDGTVLVKDINTGTTDSNVSYIKAVNGSLYFSATDGVHGTELWKSDGTAAGTALLDDIKVGSGDSSPDFFEEMGGNLYFSADDGVYGDELWKSDGTTGNREMVKDIQAGENGSLINPIEAMGSSVYFAAEVIYDTEHYLELWKSDGTANGTTMISNPAIGFLESINESYSNILSYGGNIYFAADNGINGLELWRSDGSASGTAMLLDIAAAGNDSFPDLLTAFGDKFYFSAMDESYNYGIYQSDGTASGTLKVEERAADTMGAPGDGYLYYSDYYDLYRTDGTASNSFFIKNIVGIGSHNPQPNNFTLLKDRTIFTAQDDFGEELWRTDGTASGTSVLRDLNLGLPSSDPEYLTVLDDVMYFSADNGYNGRELMRSYFIDVPTAATGLASGISGETAVLNGTVLDRGIPAVIENVTIRRGFVYSSATSTPTATNSSSILSETGVYDSGNFSLSVSELFCGTEYSYRAFVQNKAAYAYGDVATFTAAACSCPPVDRATAYNSYPTCGPSACSSGYHVSGGVCAADSSGGSSGGGGGAISVPSANSSLTVSPSQSGNITKVFTNNNSVQLIVPQNSVGSQTTFNLAESSLSSSNAPTNSSRAFLIGGQAFSISAVNSSGQAVSSFKQPLTITIKLANLPATTTDLGVYYFDEKTKDWVFVPGAIFNSSSKSVTFTSDHLTLFAIFKLIGIKPSLADTIKTDPVVLVAPVITEAENIVNRYYSLIDVKLESQFSAKTATLRNYNYLSDTEKEVIVKFVTYGTPSTKILGAGERLGVINSYLSAFGKLPKTVADFNDVIKISTGRWPGATSLEAISKAKLSFKKIYLREADMNKPYDNAAVTITAYGLRSANRNLNSEKAAIKIYKGIFKKAPTTATDWDTVRTIAYSGAKR